MSLAILRSPRTILLLLALTLLSSDALWGRGSMTMRTKVQGGAVTKNWETDSVTISLNAPTRILTITGYFPAASPTATNKTQELTILFRNFDGARSYPLIDGDAIWENWNTGDSLCHYVSGGAEIDEYVLNDKIVGNFNFLCRSVPRTGNQFNTVVEGEFTILLEPAVTSPTTGDVLEPMTTHDITWYLPGRDRIHLLWTLETDPELGDAERYDIAENVDASLGRYTWTVPDTMSPQAYIMVVDAETNERIGNSREFKVRGPQLARLSVDPAGSCATCPYYEYFNPARHGWNLPNESESFGPLYRSDVDRFQYTRAVDPITGHPYYDLAAPPVVAREHYYPEWPNWVETYDVDAAYVDADGELVPDMIFARQWKYISEEGFEGTCYGLTSSAALAFTDPAPFLGRFPTFGSTDALKRPYDIGITNEIRDVMATLQSYCFSLSYAEVQNFKEGTTAMEVVDELKRMLEEDDLGSAASSPVVVIESDGPDGGAHALLAYEVYDDPDDDPTIWIYVYDPNYPGDEEMYITVNEQTGEWSFYGLGWSGTTNIYLPEPLTKFYQTPTLDPSSDLFRPLYARRGATIHAVGSGGVFDYSTAAGFSRTDASVIPRYPVAGPNPPYGYLIGNGPYIADMTAVDGSGIALGLFDDDLAFNYESDAVDGQTDRVSWGDEGMTITNPGATPRTIYFDALIDLEDGSRMIAISGLELAGGDSIRFEVVEDDLRAINYGGATDYEIAIRQITRDGFDEGSYDPVDLGAGETQTIAPEWWNLSTRLPVYIDPAGGGASDTLYLLNQLMGVDDERAPEVTGIRIATPLPDLSTMTMTLEQTGTVRIDAHDALGKNVATLFEGRKEKGTLELPIDASVLTPGHYILHITLDGRSAGSASVMRAR